MRRASQGPIDLIVDSMGLKVCGQGEWHVQKHGEAPGEMLYTLDGALESPVAQHEQQVGQASCFVLATHELDAAR